LRRIIEILSNYQQFGCHFEIELTRKTRNKTVKNKAYSVGLALLGSLGVLSGSLGAMAQAQKSPQVIAQSRETTCIDLQEITTGETEVRKLIRGGVPFVGPGNIHTDFAVPPSENLEYFIVSFTPENDAFYDVEINFRYPDGAQATALSQGGNATANQTYTRRFISPTGETPFLVNTSVSGERNIAYTIAVQGCFDF
jgi:hypothetical protein